jgi:hypothetical protein
MTSVWIGVGALAVDAAGSIYSANKAADAQTSAANKAAGISQQSSAAQLAFLKQQSDQARQDQLPYSAGGTNAFNEFLRQLGIAPATQGQLSGFSTTSNGKTGSYGSQLIPLPGVSTTGQHGKQTQSSLFAQAAPEDWKALGLVGAVQPDVRHLGPGGSGTLYYDPGAHMIVDGSGQSIAAVPREAGVIPGLLHGFNNQVAIDAQGNLTSIGSHGTNTIGKLTPMTDAEKKAAQEAANTPSGGGLAAQDPNNRYGAYFSSPGYQFLYDETMKSARAGGASRGSLYSGAMLKELQNRAQGLASQDYGSYMSRLQNAAGLGQAAAAGQAANASALGTNGATIMQQAASDQANARLISGASTASSIVGANNAFQSTLGSGLTALGNYYASQKIPSSTQPGYGF